MEKRGVGGYEKRQMRRIHSRDKMDISNPK